MIKNHIFSVILIFACNFLFSQSADILLNGTVSAENNQIKNVANTSASGDAIIKYYF